MGFLINNKIIVEEREMSYKHLKKTMKDIADKINNNENIYGDIIRIDFLIRKHEKMFFKWLKRNKIPFCAGLITIEIG